MSKRVVIIGGGMAGTRLAELLGPSYDVSVLGDEGFYHRTRLTEYVAGRAVEPVVSKGYPAIRIDRGNGVVVDGKGMASYYDHLVFATGAEPIVPVGIEGHHVLRSAADAIAIVERGRNGREDACEVHGIDFTPWQT